MEFDQVIQADCIDWMARREEPFADLVFADPPFNIGYKYDVYEDRKAYDEYTAWTEQWMAQCARILKPTGTFWIAIGAEYAAEVRLIGRKLGLTLRNWIVWHYTFGQSTKQKYARAHAHLFYFVKDPVGFHFDDGPIRTFSDRQRIYRDSRANPKGRIPDDVWSEFARVCGTFKEREGWHPCQMPVSILSRIILSTSKVGDVVFDPFTGSGTTLVAAKRLSRRYLGTEMSEDYVANIRRRLDGVVPVARSQAPDGQWPEAHDEMLLDTYAMGGVSTTMLHDTPHLIPVFATQFHARLAACGDDRRYTPQEVWDRLEHFRRAQSPMPQVKIHAREPTGKARPCPELPDKPPKERTKDRKLKASSHVAHDAEKGRYRSDASAGAREFLDGLFADSDSRDEKR